MKPGYFNIKKMMILLLGVVAVSSGCKKNESDSCSISMNSLANTYKLVALKYKASPSAPEQDYYIFYDDCEKDDFLKLNSNGTYEYTDAGISCTPSGSGQGTWSLSGNTVTSDGLVNGTITSFDCNTLVTVVSNVNTNGDSFIMTLQKQ